MNTSQNINAGVNTLIGNAIHAANIAQLEKESAHTAKPVEVMHTVIVRIDVQNKPAVFFPDSYKKDEHTIDAWSGEKGSSVYTTNADYYFTSRPADASIVEDMSKKYSDRFKVKKLLVRQRLYKTGTQVRADNPKQQGDDKAAMREFADRLVESVTKAIYAALDPQ